MHASGFVDAPVSKGFLALVLVGSIVVGLTETKSLFWVAIKPHLTDYSQFWRLLIWQSCYTSTTEMLAGAIAIYQLRVIERLWGSRKFLVCSSPRVQPLKQLSIRRLTAQSHFY